MKDDDPALAARLGRHHRELGTGDELARVGSVVGPERDPGRDGHRPRGIELGEGDPFRDPLGERMRDLEIARGENDRKLLSARPAHVVAGTHHGSELVGQLGEDLVPGCVPVNVVDPFEVVEVEHQQGHRFVLGGALEERIAEPLVEGAVVPEARERVGLGLELETRAHMGVVERERGGIPEPDGQPELLLGELLQPDAVDVERPLDAAPGDERDGDQRLRVGGSPLDESHARIEVGAVREHGLAMVDGPARDPLPEGEGLIGQHLVCVVAAGKDAPELAGRLVGLVEREIVVWDQLADGVRDAFEQGVERVLGEHVVEHVGQPAVRLDECEGCPGVVVIAAGRRRRGRRVVGRRVHDRFPSSSAPGVVGLRFAAVVSIGRR